MTTDTESTLVAVCDKHQRPNQVCCRTLVRSFSFELLPSVVAQETEMQQKGDDERTLIDPAIVRDLIIGLSFVLTYVASHMAFCSSVLASNRDGLTVPFALTAGLASLGNSKLVIVGGIAELISGAISMVRTSLLSLLSRKLRFLSCGTGRRRVLSIRSRTGSFPLSPESDSCPSYPYPSH